MTKSEIVNVVAETQMRKAVMLRCRKTICFEWNLNRSHLMTSTTRSSCKRIKLVRTGPTKVEFLDWLIYFRKLSFNPSKGTYDICCGDFPNVKSFNSFGGRRACCAKYVIETRTLIMYKLVYSNVYDIRKNECCDGLIKQLGSCWVWISNCKFWSFLKAFYR